MPKDMKGYDVKYGPDAFIRKGEPVRVGVLNLLRLTELVHQRVRLGSYDFQSINFMSSSDEGFELSVIVPAEVDHYDRYLNALWLFERIATDFFDATVNHDARALEPAPVDA